MITVIGHRANTPRWIKRLISEGAHGVEIDFYCRNGMLYASHLSVIGRARLLRERIAALLTSLHILGPYPVEELVAALPPRTPLMLDLKSGLEPSCIDRLYKIGRRYPTYISVRDYSLSPLLAEKGLYVLLSMDHRPIGILDELRVTSAVGVSVNKKYADERLVKLLHDNNYVVAIWTINSFDEAVQAKKLGVDMVVTDYPRLVNKALEELQR